MPFLFFSLVSTRAKFQVFRSEILCAVEAVKPGSGTIPNRRSIAGGEKSSPLSSRNHDGRPIQISTRPHHGNRPHCLSWDRRSGLRGKYELLAVKALLLTLVRAEPA